MLELEKLIWHYFKDEIRDWAKYEDALAYAAKQTNTSIEFVKKVVSRRDITFGDLE